METINALLVGEASVSLGAGRLTKESQLDYDAGIQLIAKKVTMFILAIRLLIYIQINQLMKKQLIKFNKLIQLHKDP